MIPRRFQRLLMPLLCVLWACFIFSNSLQTGEHSGEQSMAVMLRLSNAGILLPEWVIRKLGHLSEYLIYGLLLHLTLACRQGFSARFWLALAIGAATGAADELLQRLVPGRSGQFTDVLIDSTGVFLGLLAAALLFAFLSKQQRKEEF